MTRLLTRAEVRSVLTIDEDVAAASIACDRAMTRGIGVDVSFAD
jgi:hypothetical protein